MAVNISDRKKKPARPMYIIPAHRQREITALQNWPDEEGHFISVSRQRTVSFGSTSSYEDYLYEIAPKNESRSIIRKVTFNEYVDHNEDDSLNDGVADESWSRVVTLDQPLVKPQLDYNNNNGGLFSENNYEKPHEYRTVKMKETYVSQDLKMHTQSMEIVCQNQKFVTNSHSVNVKQDSINRIASDLDIYQMTRSLILKEKFSPKEATSPNQMYKMSPNAVSFESKHSPSPSQSNARNVIDEGLYTGRKSPDLSIASKLNRLEIGTDNNKALSTHEGNQIKQELTSANVKKNLLNELSDVVAVDDRKQRQRNISQDSGIVNDLYDAAKTVNFTLSNHSGRSEQRPFSLDSVDMQSTSDRQRHLSTDSVMSKVSVSSVEDNIETNSAKISDLIDNYNSSDKESLSVLKYKGICESENEKQKHLVLIGDDDLSKDSGTKQLMHTVNALKRPACRTKDDQTKPNITLADKNITKKKLRKRVKFMKLLSKAVKGCVLIEAEVVQLFKCIMARIWKTGSYQRMAKICSYIMKKEQHLDPSKSTVTRVVFECCEDLIYDFPSLKAHQQNHWQNYLTFLYDLYMDTKDVYLEKFPTLITQTLKASGRTLE